jgi:hypothetical protein
VNGEEEESEECMSYSSSEEYVQNDGSEYKAYQYKR